MELLNLSRQRNFTALKVIAVIAILLLITACGFRGRRQEPTPTATLPPVATMTPAPTATVIPTETNTPEPPADTPTTVAAAEPTSIPTDTPPPPPPPSPPPTEEPTVTPVPLTEVSEARVIYHDAKVLDNVGKYESSVEPWIDLLVRMGDNWYGPERQVDDIEASPLPEGYRWETEGSFSTLPSGEAWWTAPGVKGKAILIGPDEGVLYTLELQIDFY
jgi:hypothetical protein